MVKRVRNKLRAGLTGGFNQTQNLNPGGNDLLTALEIFIHQHRLKNSREVTINWYNDRIIDFKKFLDLKDYPTAPLEISREILEKYIIYCRTELKNSSITVNTKLRALKGFFSLLHRESIIPVNPAKEIEFLRVIKPVIPTFTPEQIKKLMEAPDTGTFTGIRDYVIIFILLDTGIRVSELVNVKVNDIIFEDDLPVSIIVRMPKGKAERPLPLASRSGLLLRDYLNILKDVFNEKTEYLFPTVNCTALSKRTLQERLNDYGKKAGLTGVRVSPHTFRHTFAKMWVMSNGDILSLQDILGHRDVTMVKNYSRLFQADIRIKHKQFSPINIYGF